jgi:MoxR-like ATPase
MNTSHQSPSSSECPPAEIAARIRSNIERVITGQSGRHGAITKLLAAFASGGHVLLEDYPGTGKTMLAKALALSIGAKFTRIQFTPDLLPSDILGITIFERKTESFTFNPGPIFTDILLADEINRSSPRTQSALLEAMAEKQVTVDGQRRPLDDLFFVMATQNPVELAGTYPLPEAQMDRFALQFSLGYVSADEEVSILTAQEKAHPIDSLAPCVAKEEILALRRYTASIQISQELKHYLVNLIRATRSAPGVQMGASPRASLALMKSAQAMAVLNGDEFVTPDHIRDVAVSVIAHRLVLDPQARFSGLTTQGIVEEILKEVPVPV